MIDSHPGELGPSIIVPADAVLNRQAVETAAQTGSWAKVDFDPLALGFLAHPIKLFTIQGGNLSEAQLISDWSYQRIFERFGSSGCSVNGCRYHDSGAGASDIYYCSLNLSDGILLAGYTLPSATNVNYCDQPVHANPRVRNADGMARVVKAKNGGRIDVSGWTNRPAWRGIVYFEGGPDLSGATGHIDLWSGSDAVHKAYPSATTIWFWQLAN